MRVLSFSGGRTSAFMFANYDYDIAIFCNTGKEAEGTLDFVHKCSEYFDKNIIWLEYTTETKEKFKVVNFETASRKGEPFEQLIKKSKFLPNQQWRFCTVEMKAKTIKRYLKSIGVKISDVDMLLGIRKDEPNRFAKLTQNERNGWSNIMPLFKDGIIKADIFDYWNKHTFDLNINSHEGNCDLCFLKGIAKKVKLLQDKPHVADWWIEMEKNIGGTFNKDFSVSKILERSKCQQTFNFDDSIDCFCNID